MPDCICVNTNSTTFFKVRSSPCGLWGIWNALLSFIDHAHPVSPWPSYPALPCDSATSAAPQRNFSSLNILSYLGPFRFLRTKRRSHLMEHKIFRPGNDTSWAALSSLHPHPLFFTTLHTTFSLPFNKPIFQVDSSPGRKLSLYPHVGLSRNLSWKEFCAALQICVLSPPRPFPQQSFCPCSSFCLEDFLSGLCWRTPFHQQVTVLGD